ISGRRWRRPVERLDLEGVAGARFAAVVDVDDEVHRALLRAVAGALEPAITTSRERRDHGALQAEGETGVLVDEVTPEPTILRPGDESECRVSGEDSRNPSAARCELRVRRRSARAVDLRVYRGEHHVRQLLARDRVRGRHMKR